MCAAPRDFLLNPCGDWDLSTGDTQIVKGADAVRQRWLIRIRQYKGEWFLDTEKGVPYFQEIFQKQTKRRRIESIIYDVTANTPGISQVVSVRIDEIDVTTRRAKMQVEGYTDEDEYFQFFFDGSLGDDDCKLTGTAVPLTIEGLRIWFDAQNAESQSYSGSVLRMENLGGTGHALSKGGTGLPDMVGTSGINNKPAVRFANDAGQNQYLEVIDTPAIRGTDGITIVIVHKPDENGESVPYDVTFLTLDGTDGITQEYYGFGYQGKTTESDLFLNQHTIGESVRRSAPLSLEANYLSPEISSYRGVSGASGNASYFSRMDSYLGGSPGLNPKELSGDGYIGAGIDPGVGLKDYFTGDIGEVIVYEDKISDTDLDRLIAYLKVKWGFGDEEGEGWGFGYFPFGLDAFGLD